VKRPRTLAQLALTVSFVVVLAATGCGGAGAATVATHGALPVPDHILVVVLENKDVEQVLGSPDAPYLNSLAAESANFVNAHAETHPSQPNYLALFSGDTQGVTDDTCLKSPLSAPSLGGRVQAAGRTFVGYAEDLPAVGYAGCAQHGYARKHNPWVNFADVPPGSSRPLSDLPTDYVDLPNVAFLIPNLCHDMHDCDVSTGDTWLRENVARYAAWAVTHNSLLLVTFDESESHGDDNGIVTVLSGAMVRAGTYDESIDHYRLLRTITEMYRLPPLGRSAQVEPITDVWAEPGG
jgi:phosphatidylinositol-3-phosphatase